MSADFHTVDRAAERLGLHPKTVLRLIHEGRLRATRIGKAYRILRSDLDVFAGAPPRPAEPPRATCIVDLPDLSADQSSRIATSLQAALNATVQRPDPIRLDTIYDPARRQLKVVLVAAPADAAAILQLLNALVAGLTP